MRLPAAAESLLGGEFSTGEMGNFQPALTSAAARSNFRRSQARPLGGLSRDWCSEDARRPPLEEVGER